MQVKINKRSAYAPIRYEATRPYAVAFSKTYMNQARQGEQARRAFVQSLPPRLEAAISKFGVANGPGPLQSEIVNIQVFGAYHEAGRVIFDIAPGLTSSLALTDADAIPCGELPLPGAAFYIHFGTSSGLFADGYEVEGAFVHHAEEKLMVDLVPRAWGSQHFFALPMGEPVVGVSVDMSDPAKTITDALTDSIRSIMEANASMFAQIAEVEAKLTAQYGEVIKVPTPVERLDDKEPLLKKALGLIVNVLFFLAAEPGDIVDAWGRDTPREPLDALSSTVMPGRVKSIENSLLKAGYRKVRFVGRTFADSVASRAIHEAIDTGRTLATHFRRGHFKRQPYGPERSLRKTIFVAPVVVNAGKGDDQSGRIYDVR